MISLSGGRIRYLFKGLLIEFEKKIMMDGIIASDFKLVPADLPGLLLKLPDGHGGFGRVCSSLQCSDLGASGYLR